MSLSAIDDEEAKDSQERFLGLEIAQIERNSDQKGISTEIFGYILPSLSLISAKVGSS